jgi:hypothetical protein
METTLTPDLDELERLLKQATPGPWTQRKTLVLLGGAGGFDLRNCPRAEANAALIAALRNHAEELVRDARRWRDFDLSGVVHDAVLRALDEAGVRNEVLRGMCLEVAIEKAQAAIAQEQP